MTSSRHPVTTAASGAVADPRGPVVDQKRISNGFPVWHQRKYECKGANIPVANWEEIWLIMAEIEGGQRAGTRRGSRT